MPRSTGLKVKTKVESEKEMLEKAESIVTRYFQEARHVEDIIGIKEDLEERDIWRRYGKERMKTVSVALVLCLHIGVDPPDAGTKPDPCAKLEGWIDPFSCSPHKASAKIAHSLQKSYERWQPRARYKTANDPTIDDVKKLCLSMRRNAKDERVLFHYNGHGVPRPTDNGEIWVFNKNYTQYIPLSIYDLQSWMECPSIYVWDCAAAELIVTAFQRFADDHDKDWQHGLREHLERRTGPMPPLTSSMGIEQQAEAAGYRKRPKYRDCVHLAACRASEFLPTHADLPADLFTSCLTTPIQTSILWYLIASGRKSQFPPNLIDEIPGQLTDRRTLLGELNWIFTAITDTIAWNALERETFQRLFRQDLLLASLFRSFLLAERIMAANGCGVVSSPSLPSTADHPLWDSWDYTLDLCLNHIHNVLLYNKQHHSGALFSMGRDLFFAKSHVVELNKLRLVDLSGALAESGESQHNWFFIEQLTAFEVWLSYGVDRQQPPQQLPVVLQVLLSQVHRTRALELLARFLDLGQWAVGHALSVGIFPYVLKLLQSNTRDLRPWLAFIWAKILAVDPGCQSELFKENGEEPARTGYEQPGGRGRGEKKQLRYFYFVQMLNDPSLSPRQKIVPAFVLATLFHNNYVVAQENLTEKGYVNLCTELMTDPVGKECRMLKLWILIGLGRLWADYNDARWQAIRLVAYEKVLGELDDPVPEVRAAAVYALGCLVRNRSEQNEHAATVEQLVCDGLCSRCTRDGAVIVREELVVALQWFVLDFENRFAKLFLQLKEEAQLQFSHDGTEVEQDSIDAAATIEESRANPNKTWHSSGQSSLSLSASFYRRKRQVSESVLVDEAWVAEEVAAEPTNEDAAFRKRAAAQLELLEPRAFNEPLQRTWISLLRLSLDPIEKVARMAQVLVRRIEQRALEKELDTNERMEERIITTTASTNNTMALDCSVISHHERSDREDMPPPQLPPMRKISTVAAPSVMFQVGSPADSSTLAAYSPLQTMGGGGGEVRGGTGVERGAAGPMAPASAERKHSLAGGPLTSTPKPKMSTADASRLIKEAHSTAFTPKRTNFVEKMTGPVQRASLRDKALINHAQPSIKMTPPPQLTNPVVTTELVAWCSRIFTEPILDLIQCEEGPDGMTDRLLTEAIPTDWAYHTEEGLQQRAQREFAYMHYGASVRSGGAEQPSGGRMVCEQSVAWRSDAGYCERPSATAWSRLRPVLYWTDGHYISMLKHDQRPTRAPVRFHNGGGNTFAPDSLSSLLVINEMSREMLLAGSSDGLVRIWDPCYSIHGHELESPPQLISSAFPLHDQVRTDGTRTNTMYEWSQRSGRLVCGGNVKVCRVWDAHCERTAQDLSVGIRKGAPCALAADLNKNHLVALGFRDGSVHVHDTRMPSAESRILDLNEQTRRIVGVAITADDNGNPLVVSGSEDGAMCVWEPRMYKEPTVDVNVGGDYEALSEMRVHNNGMVIGCVLRSRHPSDSTGSVKLFDIHGKKMGQVRQNDSIGRGLSAPLALSFHRVRAQLAVISEQYVCAYSFSTHK